MNDDIPIPIKEAAIRWKWRRRISLAAFAIVSIVLMGVMTGYFDVTGENIVLSKLIIDGMFMIILAWMGIAAVDDLGHRYIESKKAKKDEDSIPPNPAG